MNYKDFNVHYAIKLSALFSELNVRCIAMLLQYRKYMLTWRVTCTGNGKAIPVQAWGLQEVEDFGFQVSRHMKVVRLSTLRTGRLYPPPPPPK